MDIQEISLYQQDFYGWTQSQAEAKSVKTGVGIRLAKFTGGN
jgi:hypothetical protein